MVDTVILHLFERQKKETKCSRFCYIVQLPETTKHWPESKPGAGNAIRVSHVVGRRQLLEIAHLSTQVFQCGMEVSYLLRYTHILNAFFFLNEVLSVNLIIPAISNYNKLFYHFVKCIQTIPALG